MKRDKNLFKKKFGQFRAHIIEKEPIKWDGTPEKISHSFQTLTGIPIKYEEAAFENPIQRLLHCKKCGQKMAFSQYMAKREKSLISQNINYEILCTDCVIMDFSPDTIIQNVGQNL